MVHAQTHVQHQHNAAVNTVKPEKAKPSCWTLHGSKQQEPHAMQNARQIDHSGKLKRRRLMAATKTMLTQMVVGALIIVNHQQRES